MYDELVKRLRDDEAWKNCDFDFIYGWMHEAADAIEALSKKEKTTRWIPVTERLPEKEDEAVIVWEEQGFALIDWRHDNKWAILDNNYGIATHWMPLPEPPKEET